MRIALTALFSLFIDNDQCIFLTHLTLLSDEVKEILDQMRDKQLDLSTLNERKAFISGFRIGARIMLEVMGWTEPPKTAENKE